MATPSLLLAALLNLFSCSTRMELLVRSPPSPSPSPALLFLSIFDFGSSVVSVSLFPPSHLLWIPFSLPLPSLPQTLLPIAEPPPKKEEKKEEKPAGEKKEGEKKKEKKKEEGEHDKDKAKK